MGSGPKVTISKHALIKKDMRDGRETIQGGGNRPQLVHGARARPAATENSAVGVPGMIQVRMDGARPVTIDSGRVAGSQVAAAQQAIGRVHTASAAQAPRGAVAPPVARRQYPPFTAEHARICRMLVAEHIDRFAEVVAQVPEGSPESEQAQVVIATATEVADALDGILATVAPTPAAVAAVIAQATPMRAARPPGLGPALAAPGNGAGNGNGHARPLLTSPKPQISGVQPKRSGPGLAIAKPATKPLPAPIPDELPDEDPEADPDELTRTGAEWDQADKTDDDAADAS